MNHVILDGQDEVVKRFVMSLTLDPEGSIVELAGQPIAYVARPPRNGSKGKPKKGPWSDEKNERRCDLIDKEIDGTLSAAEALELRDLQQEMLAFRRCVAPLPIEAARKLHQKLLTKAKRLATR